MSQLLSPNDSLEKVYHVNTGLAIGDNSGFKIENTNLKSSLNVSGTISELVTGTRFVFVRVTKSKPVRVTNLKVVRVTNL